MIEVMSRNKECQHNDYKMLEHYSVSWHKDEWFIVHRKKLKWFLASVLKVTRKAYRYKILITRKKK